MLKIEMLLFTNSNKDTHNQTNKHSNKQTTKTKKSLFNVSLIHFLTSLVYLQQPQQQLQQQNIQRESKSEISPSNI